VRLRQEEALGTGPLLLATPLARLRWIGSYLAIGGLAIVTVLVVGAVASVIAALLVGALESIEGSVLAAAAQLPAAFLFLAGVALAWAFVPRLTAGIGWGALGLAVFLGIFGQLVGLPEWTADLSPFSHSPVPLGSDTDWGGGIAMAALAFFAGLAASVFFRRRDVVPV
jgi:ABC-2 type transport system permease protein